MMLKYAKLRKIVPFNLYLPLIHIPVRGGALKKKDNERKFGRTSSS